MATLRTRYMKLDILETELLPSDVVKVKFYRPPNMKVLSGQWIRFSCTGIPPLTRISLMRFSLTRFVFFSNWTRRVSFFYINLGPTWRLFISPHQVDRSFHLETSKLVSYFMIVFTGFVSKIKTVLSFFINEAELQHKNFLRFLHCSNFFEGHFWASRTFPGNSVVRKFYFSENN